MSKGKSVLVKILVVLILLIQNIFSAQSDPTRYPVILVHGILGFPEVFALLEWRLNQAGYETLNFFYPSTEKTIREHGEDLALWIKAQTKQDTILLITHSMGNLVAREMHHAHPEIPIYRWLMVAPPNQGAQSADLWNKIPLYRWWTNIPGQELRLSNTHAHYKHLPPPSCEFAIIAGGMKNEIGFSLLLDGDDDGKVRVVETKLPGYADFLIIPQVHTGLLFSKETFLQADAFFRTGRFDSTLMDQEFNLGKRLENIPELLKQRENK
ncbi:MAG: esterase/lipase family protein [Fidelibacterota bacterium]